MPQLPVRRRTAGRRSRRVRRRSWPISFTRVLAGIGVVLVGAGGYVMSTEAAFAVDPADVTIVGASYADQQVIRQDLQLAGTSTDTAEERNVFRLATEEMERRIETLPSVLSASIQTSLPNRLVVRIRERQPILVWHTGDASWLVDVSGVVIAAADPQVHPDVANLPVIDDLRTQPQVLTPGSALSPLDIEVSRLLGAVTPASLGSSASSLTVSVDDEDGWVMSVTDGWRAVFGHFTSELHTPDDISLQVQCLTSLLTDREPSVGGVTLAVAPDRCGTFTDSGAGAQPDRSDASTKPGKSHATQTPEPDPTPKLHHGATPSPDPTRTPKPDPTRTPKPGKGGSPRPDPTPTQKPPH